MGRPPILVHSIAYITMLVSCNEKNIVCKSKGLHVTCHAGTEAEIRNGSTQSESPPCGWVGKTSTRPLYPRERAQVSKVQKAGLAPAPVWKGVEK